MSKIHISVPHKLSEEEVIARIKKFSKEARKEYAAQVSNIQEKWTGNGAVISFSAMGYDISGTINVLPKSIELEGNVPLVVSLMKNRVEKMILKVAKELLK